MEERRVVEAAPAATVVLLRDGEAGIEVLLGRRSSRLDFHGGAWVFPGGRIDPEDYADRPDDERHDPERAVDPREEAEAGRAQPDPQERHLDREEGGEDEDGQVVADREERVARPDIEHARTLHPRAHGG